MSPMTKSFVFGYGSLVNARTHSYDPIIPATLRGYRRLWQPSPIRPVAYLTVVADAEAQIEGAIAGVAPSDWPGLAIRERAYKRIELTASTLSIDMTDQTQAYVYAVESANPPNSQQPILLSYIDTVIDGYWTLGGAVAAQNFFDTTTGWETPVLNDRASPRYGSAQAVSGEIRDFVDRQLSALMTQMQELE